MINRSAFTQIKRLLNTSPAVVLLGPRQCGKTTLAKKFSKRYFDLEKPEDQTALDVQWNQLIEPNKGPLILDEAQEYPLIFPKIRSAIDSKRKRNGQFLILGSISQALMKKVSESLAGRTSLYELSPLLLDEVTNENQMWLTGGYPDGGILKKTQFPKWEMDYLSTLAQRDLPLWGLPAKPQMTIRLFKMLAAIHGQIWNASQVGLGLGLSYHSVNSYLDVLENAFLIRPLPPYSLNFRKRLVKSPKVYWRDTGLLHSLLQVTTYEELLHQPWVGFSWEGWVIEQILGFLKTQQIPHDAYFFRTSSGEEIDLILKIGGKLLACEIKLASSPNPHDIEQLKRLGTQINAQKFVFISRSQKTIKSENTLITNIKGFLTHLNDEYSDKH